MEEVPPLVTAALITSPIVWLEYLILATDFPLSLNFICLKSQGSVFSNYSVGALKVRVECSFLRLFEVRLHSLFLSYSYKLWGWAF